MRPFFRAKHGGHLTEKPYQSVTLFSQVYSEFGFQNISFLHVYLYFHLYIVILPVLSINIPKMATAQ